MLLRSLKISGFKSFASKVVIDFPGEISAVVGPNGSGKSNVVEAMSWVLGEQSVKSLRGKKGQDLIFSGSSSSPKTSRASVSLSFSDTGGGEDTTISRTVYRDGANEYSLNNSQCRLKDIAEFLSQIGLGASRHHIISQGEADRILNASAKERKEMIEDALGLRVYQMKRDEGKRKLSRTEENTRQVKSLRNEIQPHLRFLKKQVDKAEKAVVLKKQLLEIYSSYFSGLRKKIETDLKEISLSKKKTEREFSEVRGKILDIKSKIAGLGSENEKERENGAREEINSLERDIGRCEVMISQAKERVKDAGKKDIAPALDFGKVENFLEKFRKKVEEALGEESLEKIKSILGSIKKEMDDFFRKDLGDLSEKNLEKEKESLAVLLKKYDESAALLKLDKEKESQRTEEKEKSLELERNLYRLEMEMKEAESALKQAELRESQALFRQGEMKKDIEEARVVLGESIVFRDVDGWDENEIEKDWRNIERMKIRLEESGNIGGDILREYEEVVKRDEFLMTELSDLEKSAVSLKGLIGKMEEKINVDFKNGIGKINEELGRFFGLMFGGGAAKLRIKNQELRIKKENELLGEGEDIKEPEEQGVEVSVSLPKKKISSLSMLSGGERALTSIALLFAMSRVNPPPFLVLDETDAALDESNSRKYAKMLKDLSKNTQLILVTHNRETMEAAKVLYGVTMDGNGVSRLLSIKLEEAEQLTS